MSIKRILSRVPSAKKIGVGKLSSHELKFHKVSNNDGSAKCDIIETGQGDSEVMGVLFEIDEKGKSVLDRKEGLNYGYAEKEVEVTMNNGEKLSAFTYYATNINENLKPFNWYKEHVLRGATENNFPEEYIKNIEKIEATKDPDKNRHDEEMKIYR